MPSHARPLCPECETPMVPSLRGFACPRLGSCGRGGVEERGDKIKRPHHARGSAADGRARA